MAWNAGHRLQLLIRACVGGVVPPALSYTRRPVHIATMAGAVRKIIHVDMDAFFASVEQRDAPELRGKPVAVGGSSGRGVVAAASYEARKFGVRSAMPSVTAIRRCPDLIFVRPRFEVYKAVSQQIRAIFLDYTDLVEPLSLDEAYLDVTANRRGLPSATATAEEIRARIKADTGLTASAGISYNKFLAKLASDMNKPDGQFVIPVKAGPRIVAGLEVKRFHGIGPKTAERMERLGIRTGADLAARDLPTLQRQFGKSGAWYYNIARAHDERPVQPNRIRKSSGSETTFSTDLTDPAAIDQKVIAMADDVWGWVEKTGMHGRTVTVKAKYGDFRIVTRSRTLSAPVADRATLYAVARALTATLFPLRMGIRLVGVTMSGFDRTSGPPQLDLL